MSGKFNKNSLCNWQADSFCVGKRPFAAFNEKPEPRTFEQLWEHSVIDVVGLKWWEVWQYSLRENLALLVNLKTHDACSCFFFQPLCRNWPRVEVKIEHKVFIEANCCYGVYLAINWPRQSAWQCYCLGLCWARLWVENCSKQILPKRTNVNNILLIESWKRISQAVGPRIKPSWLYQYVDHSCY